MNTKTLRDWADTCEKLGSAPPSSMVASALREAANELDRVHAQLDAIDAISEDDWENGQAASWVCRIRNGETLDDLVKDGMKTQDTLEERYFSYMVTSKGSVL
jgi:hypothetical protein